MNGDRLIVKSNILIETPTHLTVFENRLLACILSLIGPRDTELNFCRIYIPNLRRFIGIAQGYNNHNIQEKLGLFLEKSVNAEDQIKWCESAKVDFEHSEIEIKLNPRLSSYLLQLTGNFTCYPLHCVIRFTNKHSFKIYDLLKQYEKFGFRLIELEKLRYWLGLQPDEYLVFKNFRNRVLIPVQNDINSKSDLSINFELITRGRRIVGIKFIVRRSPKSGADDEIKELLAELPDDYRDKQTIREILFRYSKMLDREVIKRNIRYAIKHSRGNFRAYLVQALENDWGLAMAEDEIIQQQNLDEHHRLGLLIQEEEERQRLLHEKNKQVMLDQFYSLSKSEQAEIELKIERDHRFLKHLPKETKIWVWMEENRE